ncbi:MAG TPA: amino acid adenylation domain-containing protein [Streptosporangiaceae bacterium]
MTDLRAGYPASFGQEQVWFVDRFHPDVPLHNIPLTIRLRGPLDADALRRALDALVVRHEALRTRLAPGADGRPVPVVGPPHGADLPLVPAADLGDPPDAGLKALVARESARRFSLEEGGLWRACLVRLADDDHVLLFVAHAIIFDAGSIDVLVRDLAALYGGAEAVSAEAGRFTEFARREREYLQGHPLAELVGYWRDRLDGFQNLQLPTDRPRPIVADHKGGVESLHLGVESLDGLRELSRRAGATLFATLMAGLQVLLHRYTGQDDIVVGAASANRDRATSVIGPLASMLPVRTDLAGDPEFRELLGRVQAVVDGAYAHADLPFARLVDELAIERDTGRPPVFQVALTLSEAQQPIDVDGVTMRLERVGHPAARFDLDFFAEVRGDGLRVEASYATALFDAGTVRRMLGHLRVLLEGAAADPTRRLSELPVLTEAELRRELVEWNDTAADLPVMCIHEGFQQQAARTPDGTAAEMDGEHVTYAELNADANRIARHLHALGVGPEVLVGVSMAPSIRRLAVLLGIMKAGGGYVPLDPALPADRLSYMIDDTGMPVIAADTAGAAGLPATAARVLRVEDEWPDVAALPAGDPGFPVEVANVAYVIYTSGSTGRPKGVVVEHRQVVNHAFGMIEHWPIGPDDRVLQFASLNFDVSVMDMFVALLSGARAVLASTETLHSPPRLAALMRDRKVTFASLPPAVASLLSGRDFPDLKVLMPAGEALSPELARAWLRPGLRLVNGYGPTEDTVIATFAELDGTVLPPPIGRPVANQQAYVLDRCLNPVPVGVVGELHMGGAGVTRGYLNAPELTARRFIPDPFRPGGRLYKTGDLVKRLPDGNIVYLGRADGQVKIRGLRVELGEIETTLAGHPAVAQAVVVLRDDRSGDKQLVGYVRFAGTGADVAELRQHLAQRLPGYMVPACLIVLDAFPLNTSGKIDKAALPAPGSGSADKPDGAYAGPRTLTETVLTDMYARLLGHERVGIDDGFFDLGGNSLQAMQLITQIDEELGADIDVNVTAVFLAPTPRQLTEFLCEKGLQDVDLTEEETAGLVASLE